MSIIERAVGTAIREALVVVKAETAVAKNGPYHRYTLHDGTNTIEGKRWSCAEPLPEIGKVYEIRGTIGSFNGKKDININYVGEVEQEKFQHLTTPENKNLERQEELIEFLHNQLRDGIYKDIFAHVVDSMQQLKLAPAAISNHHNYAGGLLQHSLEVAMIAFGIYQGVRKSCMEVELNPDLLIVGAFLHDLGKTANYGFKGLAIEVSGAETLLGHLVTGASMIGNIVQDLGFDAQCQQSQLLQHILLSHHGKLEYGSPVKPCIPEAMIVHQADMLSFQLTVAHEAKAQENSDWTTPIYTLDGARLFKGSY